MARLMPDEGTVQQARRVLKVARERGADPIMALHDAGLLWFPGREERTRADVLGKAAEFLAETSLDALAGRGNVPATALGTKALIVSCLHEMTALS